MAVKLEKRPEKHLVDSIKRFFAEELEDDSVDLKAHAAGYNTDLSRWNSPAISSRSR